MADSQDVRDRTFRYACRIARAALAMIDRRGAQPIINQLLRAGTSVGANLEEARAASSKREFIRYSEISIREARESLYWLRLCVELRLGPVEVLTPLISEGDQIRRILTTIVLNTKKRD